MQPKICKSHSHLRYFAKFTDFLKLEPKMRVFFIFCFFIFSVHSTVWTLQNIPTCNDYVLQIYLRDNKTSISFTRYNYYPLTVEREQVTNQLAYISNGTLDIINRYDLISSQCSEENCVLYLFMCANRQGKVVMHGSKIFTTKIYYIG